MLLISITLYEECDRNPHVWSHLCQLESCSVEGMLQQLLDSRQHQAVVLVQENLVAVTLLHFTARWSTWERERKCEGNFLQTFIVLKLWLWCNCTVWVEDPVRECGAWWQWGTPLDLKDNTSTVTLNRKNKSADLKLPDHTNPSHLWWRSDCSRVSAAAAGASWCAALPQSPYCKRTYSSIILLPQKRIKRFAKYIKAPTCGGD